MVQPGVEPGDPEGARIVHIKKVERHDREGIVAIINSSANLTREEKNCAIELLDIYLNNPLQNDYFFIMAADESGRPSGYACYGMTPLTDAVYDLYWILVDPGKRYRGIGRSLLEHTESIIRKGGGRILIAETSGLPSYDPARKFYEKTGFSQEAKVKDFYKPGDDLIIYVKRF